MLPSSWLHQHRRPAGSLPASAGVRVYFPFEGAATATGAKRRVRRAAEDKPMIDSIEHALSDVAESQTPGRPIVSSEGLGSRGFQSRTHRTPQIENDFAA
jgi:hypothetical protein